MNKILFFSVLVCLLILSCGSPENGKGTLDEALIFAATFDEGLTAEVAQGDSALYMAGAYDATNNAFAGMLPDHVVRREDKGLFGGSLAFLDKDDPVIFFQAKDNITYEEQSWDGTISFWLSLTPEEDLAPGYTDPIQITDVGYNDGAFWVDFTNRNPRDFRMGVFGDMAVWNPKNLPPDEDPTFEKRVLPAIDPPFSRDTWTHIVIRFQGLNSGNGKAQLYLNAISQGERIIEEPFHWNVDKARIFLGLNYIGLMDEVSIFDRPLTDKDILELYQLPGGIRDVFPK